MAGNDILWSLIGLIELSTVLETLVQVDIVITLSSEEVTLLHKAIKEKHKDVEVLYYPSLLTIRIFNGHR